MSTLAIDRKALEAFLDAIGSTNFEIVARGVSLEGAVRAAIRVETKVNKEGSYLQVRDDSSGYRMNYGQKRDFGSALNAAKGGDYLRACDILLNSYFDQVEVSPITSIDMVDDSVWGASTHPNPYYKTIEPLIWRKDIETGELTGHGGARPGAGRPSVLGESRPVSFDMPNPVIAQLDAQAKERGISRAELIRELIAKGLD